MPVDPRLRLRIEARLLAAVLAPATQALHLTCALRTRQEETPSEMAENGRRSSQCLLEAMTPQNVISIAARFEWTKVWRLHPASHGCASGRRGPALVSH